MKCLLKLVFDINVALLHCLQHCIGHGGHVLVSSRDGARRGGAALGSDCAWHRGVVLRCLFEGVVVGFNRAVITVVIAFCWLVEYNFVVKTEDS